MITRTFGQSGLMVSVLGLGAGQLGDAGLDDAAVARVLDMARESGITFLDTARGYGESEARIGNYLRHHPGHFVVSTKGGYGIDGVQDWTAACITAGIERALRTLSVDVLDVFFLHSCPQDVLEHGDLFQPLDDARHAGKIRVAGYSGENEALAYAVACGRFGAIQCSVNPFDQRSLKGSIAAAHALGVVGKRPLGNAPWRFDTRPHGHYAETYWHRLKTMAVDPAPLPWDEYALRFAAFSPGVSTVITGTTSAEHLQRNVEHVRRGPLEPAARAACEAAFARWDDGWTGEI